MPFDSWSLKLSKFTAAKRQESVGKPEIGGFLSAPNRDFSAVVFGFSEWVIR